MGNVGGKTKHLWVVISDTKKHNGCGVIVNISKNKKRTREECPLAAGEHPELDEPTSWVCYCDATLQTPNGWAEIQKGIPKFIKPAVKCPPACLAKIIAGAKVSAGKPDGAFRTDYLPYLD